MVRNDPRLCEVELGSHPEICVSCSSELAEGVVEADEVSSAEQLRRRIGRVALASRPTGALEDNLHARVRKNSLPLPTM